MDPTTATTTKTLGNGQTVTYTYWRGAFTDTNGDRRFVNLGNVDVTTKKQARDKLAELIRSNRRPTAASITARRFTAASAIGATRSTCASPATRRRWE